VEKMNTFLVAGICLVNVALIFYTFFFINKQRKKTFETRTIIFLFIGIIFDIISTLFMILGSQKIELSFHGIIGYLALGGMIIDFLVVLYNKKRGNILSKSASLYTNTIYTWWILVYIYGFIHIMLP